MLVGYRQMATKLALNILEITKIIIVNLHGRFKNPFIRS